jgi:hypothetical protein
VQEWPESVVVEAAVAVADAADLFDEQVEGSDLRKSVNRTSDEVRVSCARALEKLFKVW